MSNRFIPFGYVTLLFAAATLDKGQHRLTLAVDTIKRKAPVRLEIKRGVGSPTVLQLNQ